MKAGQTLNTSTPQQHLQLLCVSLLLTAPSLSLRFILHPHLPRTHTHTPHFRLTSFYAEYDHAVSKQDKAISGQSGVELAYEVLAILSRLSCIFECCDAPQEDEDADGLGDYDAAYGGFMSDARDVVCTPKVLTPQLRRWAALTTAHIRPSIVSTYPCKCSASYLHTLVKTQRMWNTAAESHLTDAWLQVYGEKRWHLATMLDILKQHWIPSKRETNFELLRAVLSASDFYDDASFYSVEDWAWGVLMPSDPDKRLEQALFHTLAYRSLLDLHLDVTSVTHLARCRNISDWFKQPDSFLLSFLGKDCQKQAAATSPAQFGSWAAYPPWQPELVEGGDEGPNKTSYAGILGKLGLSADDEFQALKGPHEAQS